MFMMMMIMIPEKIPRRKLKAKLGKLLTAQRNAEETEEENIKKKKRS